MLSTPAGARRPRRRHVALLMACLLVAAGVVVIVRLTDSTDHRSRPRSTGLVTIAADGGARIQAFISAPSGPGPFPLVVMPASWGATYTEYAAVSTGLVARGYEVVSYSQRGFGGSTGLIDLAGLPTQKDVSTVITWVSARTPVIATQIAAVGVSYGAGVSLLAAERDPRIKAVVAMSGWADLSSALSPNQSVATQTLTALLASARARGHLDSTLQMLATELDHGEIANLLQTLAAMSASRSAANGVDALNKHRTAVMLSSGFEDSLLPPGNLLPFFNSLTGPKRIQLAPGDHGGPEASGLVGRTNQVWDDATAWLDHYLRGVANGIDHRTPVVYTDAVTGERHGYSTLEATAKFRVEVHLTGSGSSGTLSTTSRPGPAVRIRSGQNSSVDLPVPQLDLFRPYSPSATSLSTIDPSVAAVWRGSPTPTPALVNGSVTLGATLLTSTRDVAIFAYLYDVDALGSARLITYCPYTAIGVTPMSPQRIALTFEPISWTLAAGHRVSLVIDTVDPRYAAASTAGVVQIGAVSGVAPTLTVPLG